MDPNNVRPQSAGGDDRPAARPAPEAEGGLRAPPGLGRWGKFWWWVRFWLFVKTARLRFIAVLAAVGGVIAYWDTLMAWYDKVTRPAAEQVAAAAGFEFWCPMHPTITREQPDKCPICGMPLSKRKKGEIGEEEPLPPGVVNRIQLTPYRVALAGIRTARVGYEPLTRVIRTVGFVEFDERKLARITARVTGKTRIDKLFVNVTGQTVRQGEPLALVYSPDLVVTVQNLLDARDSRNDVLLRVARDRLRLWGIEESEIKHALHKEKGLTQLIVRAPMSGHVIRKYPVEGEYVEEGSPLYDVADLSTVWLEAQVYEDDLAFLRKELTVEATTRAFPGRVFRGKLALLQPHLDAATRTLRVRFDMDNPGHDLRPGMYAAVTLRLPAAQLDLMQAAARDDLTTRAAAAGLGSALAGGWPSPTAGVEALLREAAARGLRDRGLVLAVPEAAVIDSGTRKIVYRMVEPGVYEGVEVQLGPRCGESYPVLRGLNAADEIATAGSFLIDAETRLNPAAGSTYFGASGGPHESKHGGTVRPSLSDDPDAKVKAALARLSPADRKLAEAQELCVVLRNSRLGSMGVPVKVAIHGRPVFVCCRACVKQARDNAEQTLRRADELKAKRQGETGADPAEEAKIRADLAKLSPADRRLAETQRYCAVQKENSRLGSMGKPVKVMIQGRSVFLCCEACADEAREHPAETLATVERLKVKNGRR
ncbi:MAG: efflux RND transporter periplasmic adaptor subunit [Gemmataceae bacterium]|nr:efflux RND transporter periplasmic adaptor subunit [Gemmataceae bacterium]